MKKRIISALVMALLLGPLIYAGGKCFAIAVGLMSILALKEILDLPKSHHKIPNFIQFISSVLLVILVFYQYEGHPLSYGISNRLLSIIILVYLLPTLKYKEKYTTQDAFYLLGTLILLGLTFNSVIVLRQMNLLLFIYLILIPIITDSCAYLLGRVIGKTPLSKNISPKKTVEGFISGVVIASVLCTLFYYYSISSVNVLRTMGITVVLSICGEIGDLIFSKIKRENNIKDFSSLIPGHGGILDRIDSLMFVILVYNIILKFI